MTPTRLRECLDALRWSQRDLAAALGCNDRLVRRWAAGAPGRAVPESVGKWLEVLSTTHIRHPTCRRTWSRCPTGSHRNE
jgi:hypothetical protein